MLRDPIRHGLIVAALVVIKINLFPCPFPLQPDPRSFGAIIRSGLLEPRMLESLFGGQTLLWVIHEDLAEKIEELLVERVGGGDDLLQRS